MKPITGTLVWWAKQWQIRIRTQERDVYIPTETDDKALARQRQPRLVRLFLAGEGRPQQAIGKAKKTALERLTMPPTTMAEFAEQYYERRKLAGIRTWKDEKRWWDLHVKESLGNFEPRNVSADDIEKVLLEGKGRGLAEKSLAEIKSQLVGLLKASRKARLVNDNVAELVDVPRDERPSKKRVQVTDEEFARYVAHPDVLDYSEKENERRRKRGEPEDVSREIKTLAIVARCIGGARASDLHALTWEAIDLQHFAQIAVLRPKVSRRGEERVDHYVVPEPVRPYLRRWWTDLGCRTTGPVFPCRLPGQYKGGVPHWGSKPKTGKGYAREFRRDLMAASVTRHELHHETARTLPTDFHSLRRGFVSALRRANVDAREAMALTSHTSWAVHVRYDTEARPPMLIPTGVLPTLAAPIVGPALAKASAPDNTPDDTGSSMNHAGSSSIGRNSSDNSNRPNLPEPPESLAATGSCDALPKRGGVEAPGIEGGLFIESHGLGALSEPAPGVNGSLPRGSRTDDTRLTMPASEEVRTEALAALGHAIARAAEAGDWSTVAALTAAVRRVAVSHVPTAGTGPEEKTLQ